MRGTHQSQRVRHHNTNPSPFLKLQGGCLWQSHGLSHRKRTPEFSLWNRKAELTSSTLKCRTRLKLDPLDLLRIEVVSIASQGTCDQCVEHIEAVSSAIIIERNVHMLHCTFCEKQYQTRCLLTSGYVFNTKRRCQTHDEFGEQAAFDELGCVWVITLPACIKSSQAVSSSRSLLHSTSAAAATTTTPTTQH